MRNIAYIFLAVLIFSCGAQAQNTGSVTIPLTGQSRLITRNIGRNLQLRIDKDSSATQTDFCWMVSVVRRPFRAASRNLIYTNKLGVTADPSQICAWQVADKTFPYDREILVRGYPYLVKISMLDPQSEGAQSDAHFLSGKLKVEWKSTK